ncbi:MAG: septum formation initiator family protein [candidate division WOR-3 bacterium]|nr:MAG: septum formation initiator family protein [candidate division WOR-3 bacterium]
MKKRRKRLSKRGKWLLILLVMAIPLFHFGRRVYKLVHSIHEERILEKRIVVLEAENEVLRNRISEYKRGTLIEAKARDDLGMIKKGEKVYLIIKR